MTLLFIRASARPAKGIKVDDILTLPRLNTWKRGWRVIDGRLVDVAETHNVRIAKGV